MKTRMELRNKETGEIRKARIADGHLQLWSTSLEDWIDYDDLEYLAKWWERYQEPKGMQWVDVSGANDGRVIIQYSNDEEAEKAVEKLKAWKRLKDGGVKFELASIANDDTATIFARFPNREKFQDLNGNLTKIFGGKE